MVSWPLPAALLFVCVALLRVAVLPVHALTGLFDVGRSFLFDGCSMCFRSSPASVMLVQMLRCVGDFVISRCAIAATTSVRHSCPRFQTWTRMFRLIKLCIRFWRFVSASACCVLVWFVACVGFGCAIVLRALSMLVI